MRAPYRVWLFIESSRASGRDLLEGIAQYAHLHGPWSCYWEPGGLNHGWPPLVKVDADGIIMRDVRHLREVARFGIPTVVIGHLRRESSGYFNVATDSDAIGRMAADHLIRCGFKRFAFCGWRDSRQHRIPWARLRFLAYRDRLAEAGMEPPASYDLPLARADWRQERHRLARWLTGLPRPIGVMACNDDCGSQVIEAAKLAGLAVPDSVGVIGADNDEVVCGLTDPPMTSVALDFKRAGYEAAQALDRCMSGKQDETHTITALATHIVARRSTDVVAVDDAAVAKALRLIRGNAGRPVSVRDVASAAGISRRALERRFRHELGGSILDEIRRVRTDQIARLLLETDWPVARIAEVLGFEDVQHIARYFRAVRKTSPLAYRKAHSRQPEAP